MGSHAEGDTSEAIGNASHAEGYYTKASNDAEHASGKYNKSNTGTIFSVGIGTSDTNRKNALEVDSSGNVYVTGVGGYTGVLSSTSKSIQSVINGGNTYVLTDFEDSGIDIEDIISGNEDGSGITFIKNMTSDIISAIQAGKNIIIPLFVPGGDVRYYTCTSELIPGPDLIDPTVFLIIDVPSYKGSVYFNIYNDDPACVIT